MHYPQSDRPKGKFPASGEVQSQILHMVYVQTGLLFDEGILLRGGITVGDVALSYGQLFGPAVIRGYAIESQVARFPLIVVGEEVLREVKNNPALWVNDADYDLKATKSLLRLSAGHRGKNSPSAANIRPCSTSMPNSSGAG
jgi:hypothetical protein